jgi:acetoin:2,6-dichlorophenolindophenol oxidoreductase subunit beta
MALMTYKDAVLSAIREEMLQSNDLLFLGQDVEFLFDEETKGQFGPGRVRNTPISEAGFVGAGFGAALTGMRSVVELGCSTFLYSCMDQVVNQAAKSRYMFGGQANVPLVIRAPVLCTIGAAAHHSDRPWGMFAQAPGLKIIVPTTPYDAKGLLKSAMRDGNPVLCFEEYTLYDSKGEVPDGDFTVPIGLADVRRSGTDVTIVAIATSVQRSLEAAQQLEREGISAEVIDVRSVVPLDRQTILQSVARTGRLIVVDPAPRTCSVAAEIASTASEYNFERLKAPIVRLTAPDVPVPFAPVLERLVYPTADAIVAAARKQCISQRLSRFEGKRLA